MTPQPLDSSSIAANVQALSTAMLEKIVHRGKYHRYPKLFAETLQRELLARRNAERREYWAVQGNRRIVW